MTPDEVEQINRKLAILTDDVVLIKISLGKLVDRSEHYTENCPYRVEVARNTNGVKEARADALKAQNCADDALVAAHANAISSAKLGAAVGGGGAFGALIFAAISHFLGGP